jgi:hypothetical protein
MINSKMSLKVHNPSADRREKISNAAEVLGGSKDRKKTFKAVYTSQERIKTVSKIMRMTGLNRVRANQELMKLANEDIIERLPERIDGESAFVKNSFYQTNRDEIIRLANDKKKLEKYSTRSNPTRQTGRDQTVILKLPSRWVDVKHITIDDIDSFSRVKGKKVNKITAKYYEREVKKGIQKIIGESGKFTDWGGETDDLYSTKIRVRGKRLSVAFALKGPATTGKLIMKKMGKNSDQIPRLFNSPAEVFLIQYHDQVDESIISLMESLATAKSVEKNKRIYYGVIDGDDTKRIISAYPTAFR